MPSSAERGTDSEIARIQSHLLHGMREYMKVAGGYDESHVAECAAILETFLDGVASAVDRESALRCTEQAVNALNGLNARAGGGMIETDQREDICALMIRAGHLRGFNEASEDITEPWREW